jgi:glyoxylase-like metal-dependent hydrolase (beta-lactamase superfamily II)
MSAFSALTFLLIATHPSAAALQQNEGQQAQQTERSQPASERTDLGNDLYMISGRGGNILFSTGDDGTFVIDDQYADIAESNLALIDEVSDMPVVFVLNTHYHGDHTGGNAAFFDAGATIVAHDNVRERLQSATGDARVASRALPVITFSDETTFHWNDKTIRVQHLPAAHTDGDAIVHFPDANVIHTGDILFAGRYPFIDLEAGGTVEGFIAALRQVHAMADGATTIVPGHGPLAKKSDVKATIDMLQEARRLVRIQMMDGKDRETVIAANPLRRFNETYSWAFISGDRMTGQIFDDLLANDDEARAAIERGPSRPVQPTAAERAANGGANRASGETAAPAQGQDTTNERTNRNTGSRNQDEDATGDDEAETDEAEPRTRAPASPRPDERAMNQQGASEDENGLAQRLSTAQEQAEEAASAAASRASEVIEELTNVGADEDAEPQTRTRTQNRTTTPQDDQE